MGKFAQLRKNIWMIFSIIFISSLMLLFYTSYTSWESSQQTVLNKQKNHVDLFGNSVRAFLESQESLLDVLGVQLIARHKIPEQPLHDAALDHTMNTNPAFIGLGLIAYDGTPLVASSNFDLDKVPNLMLNEGSRKTFVQARDSKKITTGQNYEINGLDSITLAMPIRKAIYIPKDASQAIAVMTAGIRLDNTPIFNGHDDLAPYHKIEIVRSDRFLQFSSQSEVVDYSKPVSDSYFRSLNENVNSDDYFSVFEYEAEGTGSKLQIVAHYDPFLEVWFVSKVDKKYLLQSYFDHLALNAGVFLLYNFFIFFLIRTIASSEKRKEKELLRLANHDALTGLPNRMELFGQIRQTLNSLEYEYNHHALLFLDIDDFKSINDAHGHEYGDLLLIETASRINQSIRLCDVLTRFGGDEFVILLSGLGVDTEKSNLTVENTVDHLLEILSKPYALKEYIYNSSVSVGIVLFDDDSSSESELIKHADIAMYRAKNSGKNTYSVFDPQMQIDVASEFLLEAQLRKAVRDNQLELFYQPQVDHDNNIIGAEGLLRWIHPENGMVGPNEFIPLAEKTGLIIPIGKMVLEMACEELSRWQQDASKDHLTLSVNVSYKQFKELDFVAHIQQLISDYHIQSGRLKLELTESMLADDIESTIVHMNELRESGVKFSLDDFGTGYSSLKYLKKLPLSQLKIDKSFINELVSDANDQCIVKTIISMSKELGFNIIAEGVETSEQKRYLEQAGCAFYQGYLFSKPLPKSQFNVYFRQPEAVLDIGK
ncbi:EAL domain-containing protein [Vibrio cortegadensis]|uniref:putative bifunctional diguanylate cyclase/phosphodiesterase n=1 Tax=Vibrio cortegadensis TaxID=1328770 RepID=UPI0021C275AE|nr:EAL domain-containing protein [Vibrio cortegadensis]MDN3695801.1 EAL domain-containing protein [Vibrio cortegadensis]